jgi:hypothetical protein
MSKVIDPQEAVDFIAENAKRLAKAKAERIYVEEYRKTIKARLMKASGVESIGAQEREAYAHPDYERHLEAIRDAVEVEERLRWLMVAAQARTEVWRSQEASNRMTDRAAQ